MLSPPTTGPAGTKGGAYVGTGPFPSTSMTCCIGSHMRKAIDSTVAMPLKADSWWLSLSLSFRAPSQALTISDFIWLGETMLAIIADGQVMSGMGMLGMG